MWGGWGVFGCMWGVFGCRCGVDTLRENLSATTQVAIDTLMATITTSAMNGFYFLSHSSLSGSGF